MSVRMYSNPLPLSSQDLPRMLWKTSGESREHLAKRECRGWGSGVTQCDPAQPGTPDALT